MKENKAYKAMQALWKLGEIFKAESVKLAHIESAEIAGASLAWVENEKLRMAWHYIIYDSESRHTSMMIHGHQTPGNWVKYSTDLCTLSICEGREDVVLELHGALFNLAPEKVAEYFAAFDFSVVDFTPNKNPNYAGMELARFWANYWAKYLIENK